MFYRVISFVAFSIFLCALASAQDDTAARIGTQQDIARRDRPTAEQPSLEVNGGDPDLGEINLVSRSPRPKMFTFSTGQNLVYTTNAFLTPDDRSTFFWNGRFNASYVPYATRDFTPRITYEQNFFRYDKFSELDFDSNALTFELKYDLKPDDSWYVFGSFSLARLYTPRGDIDEFYRFGLFSGGLTHTRQLFNLPLYFSGTLGSTFRFGDPSRFDRVTTYLNASLLYSLSEHFQFTAFIRPEGQFYTDDPVDSSRTDFNFSTGVAAIVAPNEYFNVALTASFVGNYSSSNPSDYEVFSPTLVLEGRIAF